MTLTEKIVLAAIHKANDTYSETVHRRQYGTVMGRDSSGWFPYLAAQICLIPGVADSITLAEMAAIISELRAEIASSLPTDISGYGW